MFRLLLILIFSFSFQVCLISQSALESRVYAGIGYSNFDLSSFENSVRAIAIGYNQSLNVETPGKTGIINNALSILLGYELVFNPKINLGTELSFSFDGTRYVYSDSNGSLVLNSDVRLVTYNVFIKYNFLEESSFKPFINFKPGYFQSSASIDENIQFVDNNDLNTNSNFEVSTAGLNLEAFVGVSYELSSQLALTTEFGYRYARRRNVFAFIDPSQDFSPPQNIDLDFSGFSSNLTLAYSL